MEDLNILALGDIVGRPGREIISRRLNAIKKQYNIHFIIMNGENAAGGMSITPEIAEELFMMGAEVITTGNHVWNNKEIESIIDSEPRFLRPANFPPDVMGKGYYTIDVFGKKICVVNLMGRLFMASIDCPFRKFDEIYDRLYSTTDIFIIDFHAEATSEKRAFGWYADGRASVVFGTHTHVQTADEEILPGGTAYITDIGMCGSFNSVIGMDKDSAVERFLKQTRPRASVAEGNNKINGIVINFSSDNTIKKIIRIIEEDS